MYWDGLGVHWLFQKGDILKYESIDVGNSDLVLSNLFVDQEHQEDKYEVKKFDGISSLDEWLND